jgi:Ca2+-binding EF-hand superfamily protein
MKKQFALLVLTLISLGSLQLPALADPWFDHWDRDHDGRWNYNDFRAANRAYWAAHHEHVLADQALRRAYRELDHDHDGYVTVEDVRTYHHW